MDGLAHHLMRLMALALDLDETWFDDTIDHHITNHSPRLDRSPLPGQLRRGAHSDWGSLTILHHDGQPGLQVQRAGTWTDVPVVPDAFVVNLGDLMARWTNDRWVSTMHRVVVPPDERDDRLSVAFFHQPTHDAVIEYIPLRIGIRAALFGGDGARLGVGRNQSVQHGDFLAHAETTAVRAAGTQPDDHDAVLATTMTPCWYCAGCVRLFTDRLATHPTAWTLPTSVNGWEGSPSCRRKPPGAHTVPSSSRHTAPTRDLPRRRRDAAPSTAPATPPHELLTMIQCAQRTKSSTETRAAPTATAAE